MASKLVGYPTPLQLTAIILSRSTSCHLQRIARNLSPARAASEAHLVDCRLVVDEDLAGSCPLIICFLRRFHPSRLPRPLLPLSHGAFFPCVRLVFTRAFAEIRFMLESNLMLKFVSTDEFGKALSAARHEHDGC